MYSVSELDDDGDRTISFVGASLESSGERQLRAYANDQNPINTSWNDFSDGSEGYKPRNSDLDPGNSESLDQSIEKAERFISDLINDRKLPRAVAEYHLTRYLGSIARFRVTTGPNGSIEFKITSQGKKFLKKLSRGVQFEPGDAGIAGRNIRSILNETRKLPRYIRPNNKNRLKRRFI